MAQYSFKDTLSYIANSLNVPIHAMNLSPSNPLTLEIDIHTVTLSLSSQGGLQMSFCLGLFLYPIKLERLVELIQSNFLGINTGGCTLCIDQEAVGIFIKNETIASTPPEENWAWLHRTVCVGKEWIELLSSWDEFVPLVDHARRKKQ